MNPIYPRYVINIPVKADSDDEGESSDEELDGTFPPHMFEAPEKHFQIFPERGSIVPGGIRKTADIPHRRDCAAAKVLRLVYGRPRISAVFGFNKMRSLSARRNQVLQRKLNENIKSSIPYKKVAFMWDAVFAMTNGVNSWRKTTYAVVRKFYKQLKKFDLNAANEFRKNLEKSRGRLVPYREIRDEIKNHEATKILVRNFRREEPAADVYMVFLDADIQSLFQNKKSKDLFTIFDEHYLNHKYEIFSVGYIIKDHKNKNLEFSVKCDLAVRDATAKHIKNGVYYPEPCTGIKVPDNKDTIEGSFSSKNEPDYDSPLEMPRLINLVLAVRNLDPQVAMLFDKRGAIVTTCPDRMKREFASCFSKKNKIILWTLKDFRTIRDVNQSHYNSRDWAINLLQALFINNQIVIEGHTLSNKSVIRNVLISLLSRLFNAFDPVHIAELRSQKPKTSFQKELIAILNQRDLPEVLEIPQKEKNRNVSNVKQPLAAIKLWEKADECKSIGEVLNLLNHLVRGDQVRLIYLAAKESGMALHDLFRRKLCLNYEELVFHALSNLLGKNLDEIKNNVPKPYLDIIRGGDVPSSRLIKYPKNVYSLTPLHIAAIVGNREVIAKVIENLDCEYGLKWDFQGKIPFEYGLEYCLNNGLDTSLLSLLYDDDLEDLVQELIKESHLDIDDQVIALNALLKEFGEKVIRKFDGDLFIAAIYNEFDELVDELKGLDDYSDALREEMIRIAPDVNSLLLEHTEEEDIEYLREQYEDSSEGYTLDINLRDAGYLREYVEDSDGHSSGQE